MQSWNPYSTLKELPDRGRRIPMVDQVIELPSECVDKIYKNVYQDEDPPNYVLIRINCTFCYPYLIHHVFEVYERIEIIDNLSIYEGMIIEYRKDQYIVMQEGATILSGNPKELPWHPTSPYLLQGINI